jgi:chromosome segregation ATPase
MIIGVTTAALAGWGAYAYSALSSAQLKHQLSGQTAALQEYQSQFLSQRKKADDGARELATLHKQLASAQSEVERLTMRHKEAEANLAMTWEQLASFQKLRASPALASAPALRGITPLPARQDVRAAQEALTQLGFGNLEADGVIDPPHGMALRSSSVWLD